MPSCKSVYEPQEDSTMLERYVRQYAFGKVLDIGTGSGIQAIAAAQKNNVISVLAADVQKGVIDYCKKCIKPTKIKDFRGTENSKNFLVNKKIRFTQSDLFKNIKGKFDTIIFNPPYLPQELKLKDLTIEGGKKGYETIEKFINEVNKFLKKEGIILMVFSSLTKKEKVEGFIKNKLLDFEELKKQHIFFEDIYVYLSRKNEFLKRLESKGIANVKYLTKGHRGLLFTGIYKNKKGVIKTKNPESKAVGRIENEGKWLKKLNKYKIGPELLMVEKDYFVCRFIDGNFMLDYIKKSSKNQIKKIIKNIFDQLFIMDNLKIDKEEMHHPLKHIIINKNKPYLIDFERVHYAQNPKNITQFCQFLINRKLINKHNIIQLAKIYKNHPSKSNFKKIVTAI